MRVLVAPVLVLSTLTLLTTGVLLIATPQRGMVLGLHKASFVVWIGACGIHVLAYATRTLRELLAERVRGGWLRVGLVLAALSVGVAVAVATYPLAAPWLHGAVGGGDH
jgi:glucan phosphoethanolaminetransferase (alkaline phosphatase superfamily)